MAVSTLLHGGDVGSLTGRAVVCTMVAIMDGRQSEGEVRMGDRAELNWAEVSGRTVYIEYTGPNFLYETLLVWIMPCLIMIST